MDTNENSLINKLEKEYHLSLLEETLPEDTFLKVLKILGVKDVTEYYNTINSNLKVKNDEGIEKFKEITYADFLGKQQNETPYATFLKQKPDKVAVWKDPPTKEWEKMEVGEKADAVVDAITTNFINWLDSIDLRDNLTAKDIKDMFIKEPQTKTSKSDTVEENIAEFKQPDRRIALKKKINSGKQKLHDELESMSVIWDGIANLKSTKMFCESLLNEQEDIEVPQYLLDAGFIDPALIKNNTNPKNEKTKQCD